MEITPIKAEGCTNLSSLAQLGRLAFCLNAKKYFNLERDYLPWAI